MSYHMYHLCRRYVGRSVLITCDCGTRYHGILKHVDNEKAYILPYSSEVDESGRFIVPALVGLTLGTIVGFAIAPKPYPIYPPYPPYPY
ncbi:hypothetical protein KUV80_14240 [Fictibacillus nanhaiensis]|uniref:hypothetical protein n=1 Tax=Fictibacillus nanhaiensis TaxID=742169 RepID=UPI001C93A385|nr:hypothetical protein [Fictibacillus nanhaiensis]MBY6037828.1 hypothetical protein [Fictibacillus nanhaiensis]